MYVYNASKIIDVFCVLHCREFKADYSVTITDCSTQSAVSKSSKLAFIFL